MIGDMFSTKSCAGVLNVLLVLTTTQKDASTITEYVAKMRALGDKMATAGKLVDQDELVAYIMNGIDADYDLVVEALVMRTEPVTVAELYSHLLNFENKVRLRQAYLTTSTNDENRGGSGHNNGARWWPRCAYRTRRSQWWPRWRPWQWRTQWWSGRQQTQVYHKRGHVASDCWHHYDETYVLDEKMGGATTHAYRVDTNWYVDIGATDHITSQLDKLTTREKYQGTDQIHTTSGEGQSHEESTS